MVGHYHNVMCRWYIRRPSFFVMNFERIDVTPYGYYGCKHYLRIDFGDEICGTKHSYVYRRHNLAFVSFHANRYYYSDRGRGFKLKITDTGYWGSWTKNGGCN